MEFIIGCNYWASHAGTQMWRNWNEEAIREDLEILSTNGVRYMRVFPNWRDFQPVIPVMGARCTVQKYMLEGDRESTNPYWLDELMLERFSRFCDLCQEYSVKIMVGLITGWMSGRMFIPSALFGKDLITDPTALLFEQRFIKGMVLRFKDKEAIYAWDLGNECNCMYAAPDKYAAANWSATMANAIRAFDPNRLVISGIHAPTEGNRNSPWSLEGEAEACDILVSHPYPYWSEFGYKDYTASMRTMVHGACQGKYFTDLGGKPCMIEEIGTMGPMICSDDIAADFMRANLFSAWVSGMTGLMWWCANEQTNLTTKPYTTNMCEVELGMIDKSRRPKPVLAETKRVGEILSSFEFELPKAKEDAVCLVTDMPQKWGTSFMTYTIAKQAGLNLRFADAEKTLPQADIYMMPSVSGNYIMPRENYLELKKRVREGATLYISSNGGILAEFEDLTGMKVMDSGKFSDRLSVKTEKYEIDFTRSVRFVLQAKAADVIAYDSIGLAAITANRYGKGMVYYVNFPMESGLLDQNNMTDTEYYKLYADLFAPVLAKQEIRTHNPYVGVTRHASDGEIYCVAINYSNEYQTLELEIDKAYQITEIYYGDLTKLAPFEACVLKLTHK